MQFPFECLLLLDGAQCQREGWQHAIGASGHPQLASLQAVQHQIQICYSMVTSLPDGKRELWECLKNIPIKCLRRYCEQHSIVLAYLDSSSSSCLVVENPSHPFCGRNCCQPYSCCSAPQRYRCILRPCCSTWGLKEAEELLQQLLNAIACIALLCGTFGTGNAVAVSKVPGFIFAIRPLLIVLLEMFNSLDNATSMLPCAFRP